MSQPSPSPEAGVDPESLGTPAGETHGSALSLSTLVGVVLLLSALVAGGLYWKKQRETARLGPPRQARQLTDFRLTERSGRPVERAEFQGKILVVNFVFTGCSLACYEVSRRMTEIQGYVASKPDVQLVSFSVDPRTDTPEVLSAFADRLKADPKRWLFLTGEKAEVYRVIEASFLPKAPLDAPSLIPGNFDRAERIVVVDGEGRVRRYFDGMSSSVVGQVLDEIADAERERKR
jgi:cytochrome oxidase Cu insertion factor (SCO1/SenC/PrrC family)